MNTGEIEADVAGAFSRAAESKSALNKLITAKVVRELCGDISDMSLWRWLSDPALKFPKPVYIQKRRFWREAEVLNWIEAKAEAREVSA